MKLLAQINEPRVLRELGTAELSDLAAEIRGLVIESVSRNGGHLGSNLGMVELTIALHRVFDSPRDSILFDTGHQAYVHKILTGRRSGFTKLRQRDGLSGYPSQAESEHDIIENSHASTALSYADGLAKAFQLRGERDRSVVVVVGDGALTGGMCWEALNNIAAARERPIIIVVNDNGRSYSPTIGGLASHLASLRTNVRYEDALAWVKRRLPAVPVWGQGLYRVLHGAKMGLKDALVPQPLFEDLGLKYIGPVDGHDEPAIEHALSRARSLGGTVIVHCITRKGMGYGPAEENDEDCLHSPGAFDPVNGVQHPRGGRSWTSVFSDEMVALGGEREDIVAITAAMLHPTGLGAFARAYPERIYDVGIAEQHAMTSAAGLALGGVHPVVAVYATFLNRAFDQLLLDIALHKLPVTVVLDRAGVTGDDGPSHNGMWDMSILQVVPGLRIAAPRDGARLRELLREAVGTTGPTVVRFPKGNVPEEMAAIGRTGGMDVLMRSGNDVLIVAAGAMAGLCVQAGTRLEADGLGVTVLDPRWVRPLEPGLADIAARHRVVAVVEDNCGTGGVGDAVASFLRDRNVHNRIQTFGIPREFLRHAKRAEVLADIGLTAERLAREISDGVSRLPGGDPHHQTDTKELVT